MNQKIVQMTKQNQPPWKIRRNNHRPINLFLNGLNYIHGLNTTKKRILCSVISVPSMGKEWALVKETVLAEHYPRHSMSSLWQLISKYHKADFPNLIKLAQLALTSAVHTAGCERGFSAQNAILTKGRNRLLVENQHKLMRVKMTADIDYEQVIQIWRQKNRRLYKAK